jgi:hypothetical protein
MDGASILVQWVRLVRVMEKVVAENGVWRRLGDCHVTLRMCGLDWYGIFM